MNAHEAKRLTKANQKPEEDLALIFKLIKQAAKKGENHLIWQDILTPKNEAALITMGYKIEIVDGVINGKNGATKISW